VEELLLEKDPRHPAAAQEFFPEDAMPDLPHLVRLREEAVPAHVEAKTLVTLGPSDPADELRLLQDDRAKAVIGQFQSGRQTRGAAPDHDDIGWAGLLFHDGCGPHSISATSHGPAPVSTISTKVSPDPAASGSVELFRKRTPSDVLRWPGTRCEFDANRTEASARRSDGAYFRMEMTGFLTPRHSTARTPCPWVAPQRYR
jgi:hypothetical protein